MPPVGSSLLARHVSTPTPLSAKAIAGIKRSAALIPVSLMALFAVIDAT
jgi:hypothetical protein